MTLLAYGFFLFFFFTSSLLVRFFFKEINLNHTIKTQKQDHKLGRNRRKLFYVCVCVCAHAHARVHARLHKLQVIYRKRGDGGGD
jgi:hypothetical protein